MTRVSVVVPTYRRPALLARCLAALLNQTLAPTAYEIIVVDDAGCADTRDLVCAIAAEAACRLQADIRYLTNDATHGPAAARNAGWRTARSPIVAFTDDDCLPTPGWLCAGLQAFAADVIGVAGRVVVPLPPQPTDYERNAAALEHSEFVTANCFYRRSALAAVGGFDERFTSAWREDSDLYFTLLYCNGRLVTTPAAIVVHPVRPAPWGISLRQQRKSMFNALLYKKHPLLYRHRLGAPTPWHYYGIVSALLALLSSLAAGRRQTALGAATLWLLLTGRFCLRRLARTSPAPQHVAEMVVTSALIPPLSIFWRLYGAVRFRVLLL